MAGHVILAGSRDGLHVIEGTENRQNWNKRLSLLQGKNVSSLALDPLTNELFVGLFDGGGVLRLGDVLTGGRIISSDLKGYEVWTVVTHSSGGSAKIYAGTEPARIYRREDGGDNWKELKGLGELPSYPSWHSPWGDADLNSIAIDPNEPQRLYVGVEVGGVSKSEDGGKSWAEADEGIHKDVHHLVLHEAKPSYFYAATGAGVYVSDAMKVWSDVTHGLKHSYVRALTLHPRKAEVFYVAPMRGPYGGDVRLYRTSDRGESWEEMRKGLPDKINTIAERKAFACDREDPAGLYLGTGDGRILSSFDEGDKWSTIVEGLPAIQCLLVTEEGRINLNS